MAELASNDESPTGRTPLSEETFQASQVEPQIRETHEAQSGPQEHIGEQSQSQEEQAREHNNEEPLVDNGIDNEQEEGQKPQPRRKEKPKEDTRQCRICFAGAEEEPDLGRLIKPCKCKGSIRVSFKSYRKFCLCGGCGYDGLD
jgi:hypothetical protein